MTNNTLYAYGIESTRGEIKILLLMMLTLEHIFPLRTSPIRTHLPTCLLIVCCAVL